MSEYGYGIILSINNQQKITDEQIVHINNIMKDHFYNNRYVSNIDHMMLFNVKITNKNDENVHFLFVRTLAEIKDDLFIPSSYLHEIINFSRKINIDLIYDNFQSVRYNKYHNQEYFKYYDNELFFSDRKEDSHKFNIF